MAPTSAPLWAFQPFKAIYTTLFLLQSLAHVLLLSLRYIVKPLRPRPELGMKSNLACIMTKKCFAWSTMTRSPYVLYNDPDKAKERCAHVQPAPLPLVTGALSSSDTVKPAPLKAVWYPSPPPSPQDKADLKKQKTVLHFPGGAFVMALGHSDAGQVVADSMASHLGADRTIWGQYRLAGTPETSFPAALQDALSFYHYVVSLGFEPKNIVLSGDSAGGNIVLGLLRHLETQRQLPLPGGAAVFSPWVHVTPRAGQDYDECDNAWSDILVAELLQWGADAYLPRLVPNGLEGYVSPLHHPFRTSIPLFVHSGAAEAFYQDNKNFAAEMVGVNGEKMVRFCETSDAPHDLLLGHPSYGLTKELGTAVKEAHDFLKEGR